MNPRRRWPLDPRRQHAPRPRPGRFASRRTPHDPYHHQPPRMAAIYAPGTVRARRWHGEGDVRGYRPPSGWSARADLTDIHPHGPRLAACRVVAHRDEGITRSAPRPGRSVLGAVKCKSGRGGGRARCSRPTATSERRRLRYGSGGGVESIVLPRCLGMPKHHCGRHRASHNSAISVAPFDRLDAPRFSGPQLLEPPGANPHTGWWGRGSAAIADSPFQLK